MLRDTFMELRTLSNYLHEQVLEPVAKENHLTLAELDILLFLANNPGCDTAQEIVKNRLMTKSYVSLGLRSLEKKHYIERSLVPGNRKTIHLKVMPSAQSIIMQGNEVQEELKNLLFEGIDEEEMDVLRKSFFRFAENMERVREKTND